MHQYFSHGMVGQELGLFADKWQEIGGSLHHLQNWVQLGWRDLVGYKAPKFCVADPMWSAGHDYRGDAQDCLQALPLLVAFSQEMLSDDDRMKSAVASLTALYDVVLCLHKCKMNWREASRLSNLQTKHKTLWDLAYPQASTRPKFHYSLHLSKQIQSLRRHVDCAVGERKHRLFKSLVAPTQNCLRHFMKSTLLQLTQAELATCQDSNRFRFDGRLLGAPQCYPELNIQLALPCDAQMGTGIEYRCVEYSRGMFLQMSATCCIEIHGGVSAGVNLFVLATPLKPRVSNGCTLWQRIVAEKALVPAQKLKSSEPIRLLREIDDSLWLLR